MTDKRCSRCKGMVPLEDYHRDRTKADGRVSICRECMRSYYKSRPKRAYRAKVSDKPKYRESTAGAGRYATVIQHRRTGEWVQYDIAPLVI